MNKNGISGQRGSKNSKLARHLRRIIQREADKLNSQREFCTAVGVPQALICKFLKKERALGLLSVLRIFKELDLDVNGLKRFI